MVLNGGAIAGIVIAIVVVVVVVVVTTVLLIKTSSSSSSVEPDFKACGILETESSYLLNPSNTSDKQTFGAKLAGSVDGKILAVSASYQFTGYVQVYSKNDDGFGFTAKGNKIESGDSNVANFGVTLSMSADGIHLVIGSAFFLGDGAVWFYKLNNSTGNYDLVVKITGTEVGSISGGLGSSCAMSSDGNWAMAGAPFDSNGSGVGAVVFFKRTATTWQPFGSKLPGTGGAYETNYMGWSCALTSDGSFGFSGGIGDLSEPTKGAGRVWVFAPNASSTAYEQKQVLEPSAVDSSNNNFGYFVTVSPNDLYMAASSPTDQTFKGSVCIFKFDSSSNTWTLLQDYLTSSETDQYFLGFGQMQFCDDGTTLYVGAADADTSTELLGSGYVYVFQQSVTKKGERGNFSYTKRLQNSTTVGKESGQGFGVFVCKDYLAAGGPIFNSEVGQVYFWT